MTKLKVTCDRGHTEQIEISFSLGPYAKEFADLLAGRSVLYKSQPALVGKCCFKTWENDKSHVCGMPIVVEVIR